MTATFRSFGKINLHLEVAGRRTDGDHELRTIFQTIDLADRIEIEPLAGARRIELEITGAELAGDASNLVHRAATTFFEAHPNVDRGVRIRLEKRVPVGGGLGGGSSNAATTLVALAAVFGQVWSDQVLALSARRLGADVPFFLIGGTALGLGRGDEIVAMPDPEDGGIDLWLAIPPWSSSTSEVFARVTRGDWTPVPSTRIAAALAGEAARSCRKWIGENALERAAFQLRSEQQALYTSLVRAGATRVRLSGSGSATWALFDDPKLAREASTSLPRGTVWQKVSTLGRDAWRRARGIGTIEGES